MSSGKLIIGTAGRHSVGFDIPELLVSRLLVQANSGGGKSFLLRRLLEQGFSKAQEIVTDIAGEFATLREKFGFLSWSASMARLPRISARLAWSPRSSSSCGPRPYAISTRSNPTSATPGCGCF